MDSGIHILTLTRGALVKEAIKEYVVKQGWKEALITGAIGSTVNVKLNNAASLSIPFTVQTTEISGPFEILSFFGQVIVKNDDEPYIHIHASGSLTNSEVHGGGLNTAEVLGDVNICLHKVN